MTEIEGLATVCEKATGPDRELDAEIGRYGSSAFLGYVPDEPQYGCRHYTASLDAAMTLVPEGWRRSIEDMDEGTPPLCRLERHDGEGEEVWSRAGTWPLALCAAALKARAQAQSRSAVEGE